MVLYTCPACGEHDISVEVRTWCRFNSDGRSFDDEDLAYVNTLNDSRAICHDCQHEGAYSEFVK